MQAVTARLSVTKRAIAVRDTKAATERAKRSEIKATRRKNAHQAPARELEPIDQLLKHDPRARRLSAS